MPSTSPSADSKHHSPHADLVSDIAVDGIVAACSFRAFIHQRLQVYARKGLQPQRSCAGVSYLSALAEVLFVAAKTLSACANLGC